MCDNACDDMQNNSVDELVAPRKPDPMRGVANMQAKLVLAAQFGRLRDGTMGTISHGLDG